MLFDSVSDELKMDTLKSMKELYEMERAVKEKFDTAFAEWKMFIIRINDATDKTDVIDATHYLMGSLADGSFSARLFSEENHVFEADFLVEVADLPEHLIEKVKDKPGFYMVKNDGRILDYLVGAAKFFATNTRTMGDMLKTFLDMGMSHGFIVGMSIKQLVEKVAGLTDSKRGVTNIMAAMCGVHPERLTLKMETVFNGPSASQNIDIFMDGCHHLSLSFDVVICARLSYWPPEAQLWETRDRKWPPKEIVAEVIRERQVHLVAKPSLDTNLEQSNDWRLTFLAEKRIIQEYTEEMRFTYFLFKVLFYRYFKADVVEGKSLPSYLAKTTMHWMCEQVDPGSWTDENIRDNLQELLHRLCDFLDQGHLPNYFVPEINLLKNIPSALLEKVKAMDKKELLADPLSCLPNCFTRVRERLAYTQRLFVYYYSRLRQMPEAEYIIDMEDTPQMYDEDLD